MTDLDAMTAREPESQERVDADLALLRLLGCPHCGADLLTAGWVRSRTYRHELPYFVHEGTVYQDWDHEETSEVPSYNVDEWTCAACNTELLGDVRDLIVRLDDYAEAN